MTSPISPSELNSSCFDQEASFIYPAGGRYTGQFKKGLRHGQGTYSYASGNVYTGQWKDGLKHGQGTHSYANGDVYTGQWKDGLKHEQGTYSYANGDVYTGQWKGGLKHGQGTYIDADGDLYVGEFKDGLKHGQGTFTCSNGCQYIGSWENQFEHGEGRLVVPNKKERKGEWIRGWPKWEREGALFLDVVHDDIPQMTTSKIEPFAKALILQSEYDHNSAFGIQKGGPEKLAKILELGGFSSAKVVYFQSAKSLQEAIKEHSEIAERVNLVWLRAHGSQSGSDLLCDENDLANESTLSGLTSLLSTDSSLVIESCNTGKPKMLAEKLFLKLCDSECNPVVIAPRGNVCSVGLDLSSLRDRKLKVKMLSEGTYKDVSQVFKRNPKRTLGYK